MIGAVMSFHSFPPPVSASFSPSPYYLFCVIFYFFRIFIFVDLIHLSVACSYQRGIDTDSVPTRSSSLPHLDTSLREPHSAPAAHSPTVPGAPTEEMSAGSSTHTQESMHLSETRRVLVELIERANSCVGYIDFSDNNVQPLLADAKDLLGRVVEQLEAGVRLSRDRDCK